MLDRPSERHVESDLPSRLLSGNRSALFGVNSDVLLAVLRAVLREESVGDHLPVLCGLDGRLPSGSGALGRSARVTER